MWLRFAFVFFVTLSFCFGFEAQARLPEHEKAVNLARNNNPSEALQILEKLHQDNPKDAEITHDLVAISLWAGQNKKARNTFFSELNPENVPLYVLESAAKAARNLGHYAEAKSLYEIGQQRDPKAEVFQKGLKAVLEDQKSKKQKNSPRKNRDLHPEHKKAMALAKAGKVQEALDSLGLLHARLPEDQKITHDLVVLAMWANHNELARDIFFQKLSPNTAPLYVLVAAAKALRNLGQQEDAASLYRIGLQREPNNKDLIIGYSYVLSNLEKFKEALDLLKSLKKHSPKNTEILFATAYVHEKRKSFLDALGIYDKILEIQPYNKKAIKARIEALRESGAPHRAHELALQSDEIFQKEDLKKHIADKIAVKIRWGQNGNPVPEKRYNYTDLAIRELSARKKAGNLSKVDVERSQFDLIQAFHDRWETKRAIQEFEALQNQGKILKDIPSYVLLAAGEAYLQLREPEKAKVVLEEAHRKSTSSYKTNILLYYTYQETEDHDKALAIIAWAKNAESQWILKKTENPARLDLEQNFAVAPFYSNLYDEAQKLLEDFNNTAPANITILRLLSDLYNARGLPRAALEEAELGLALDPKNVELKVSRINALMNLNNFEEVRCETAQLVEDYPEQDNVQTLEKDLKIFDKWELVSEFDSGESSGSTFGSKDSKFDTKLYSPPLYNHYRVFAHDVISRALFPEGMGRLYRQGAGIEYRGPDWQAEGEVDHNAYPTQRPSFRLSTTWNPNDKWFYTAQGEYFSLETPLRALKNHIFSNKYNTSILYQANEDFSAGINNYIQNFTDRNLWGGISGFVKKDILVHPKRKVDLRADVGTDFSRLTNVPYFSPKRALSYSLTTSAVDRLWRRYDNAFHHRITMGGGFYSQKKFKTEFVGKIGYQHEIKLNKLYELIYGVERSRNVYDGGLEYANTVFIKLNARF